ncbi:MAG TPA: iron uptake system protein EfeO [Actinomycetes bacterium]|nr:iron uptake system protein EfeO [Actinomycetes bacterium]
MPRRTRRTRLIIPLLAALTLTGLGACSDDSTSTDAAPAATIPDSPELDAAVAQYERYVNQQVRQLVEHTDEFARLYRSGDDQAARAAYAPARVYWERIEPVAAAFGELDPRLDLREAGLEEGQEWTGWHRIEKDLWPPASGYAAATAKERDYLAALLVADTAELQTLAGRVTLTPLDLSDGAKSLLDEIANGKVTGEEETWSHTDLWDFQANLDGAEAAYEALRPVIEASDPTLASTLDERFAATHDALEQHRKGEGFVSYEQLTPAQVDELAIVVESLSEPLSHLSASISS